MHLGSLAKSTFGNIYAQALAFLLFALVLLNVAFIKSSGKQRFAFAVAGYLVVYIAYKIAKLHASDIGLSLNKIAGGLKITAVLAITIIILMAGAYLFNHHIFQDQRYNQPLGSALFASIIILPFYTVLFEELVFRGLLPGLLQSLGNTQLVATIIASVFFGLWHVGSALKIGEFQISDRFSASSVYVVIGVFIATTIAGFIFCELRWRTGTLLAPIIIHWVINSTAIILAYLSWSNK